MSNVIKYRYAYDEKGNLIDVLGLTKSDRKDYTCVGCNNILRPALGEIKRNHFRHLTSVECSGETYLHRVAKKLFKEKYENCLETETPYFIEISRKLKCDYCVEHGPCDSGSESIKYDITKHFRTIIEETRDGNFIPDLLLIGPNDKKVYIEVAVTHECEPEKIDSGLPIIELLISEESDLRLIDSCNLSHMHEKIKFYNFKVKERISNYKNQCLEKIGCFILWNSGKAYVGWESVPKTEDIKKAGAALLVKEVDRCTHETFIAELEKAHLEGHKVTNCYLCRYHAGANNFYNFDDGPDKKGPIFCKFLKKNLASNYAADCQYYRIDTKVFGTERYEERGWYRRNRM